MSADYRLVWRLRWSRRGEDEHPKTTMPPASGRHCALTFISQSAFPAPARPLRAVPVGLARQTASRSTCRAGERPMFGRPPDRPVPRPSAVGTGGGGRASKCTLRPSSFRNSQFTFRNALCAPSEIRTRVPSLKSSCPRPLDDGGGNNADWRLRIADCRERQQRTRVRRARQDPCLAVRPEATKIAVSSPASRCNGSNISSSSNASS
jgi:hypothetical protein